MDKQRFCKKSVRENWDESSYRKNKKKPGIRGGV